MELYQAIYRRLRNDPELAQLTAVYNGGAAVFYQRPAPADSSKWGSDTQYPRIDYILDMQDNPARNSNGILTANAWCDTMEGAEPEDIEARLRSLLHATFTRADDIAYCFSWLRSDAFEIKNKPEETPRTIGVTVIFDVVACPCQHTKAPDPIKALNAWTRTVMPGAVIIGEDEFDGWLEPTKERPAVYWRLTSQGVQRKHFTHTWLNISVECHVYSKNAWDRQQNIMALNTAHALAPHIPMEDGSPLFLRTFRAQPHLNYIVTGQIQAAGNYRVMQPDEHFVTWSTGEKLGKAHVEYEFDAPGD